MYRLKDLIVKITIPSTKLFNCSLIPRLPRYSDMMCDVLCEISEEMFSSALCEKLCPKGAQQKMSLSAHF